MKILILTGNFYPELHPRAFRANELACEFAKQGHSVYIYNTRTIVGFDYKKYAIEKNFEIKNLNLYRQAGKSRTLSNLERSFFIGKLYRFLLNYFLDGRLFFYALRISKKLKIDNDVDIVISISTPFMNHLAVAFARKNNNKNTIFIADSGDPFYRSNQTKRAPYFYFLEKYTYRRFHFLTIPAIVAKSAYKNLIENDKIKVIPQGFDIKNVKLAAYNKSEVITFAFAGTFYEDIRNPKIFLDYLIQLDLKFRFEVYLRYKDPKISNLLEKYKDLLKDKLSITYALSRDDLLHRLSSVDFLIDIGNLSTTQVPSKLIDYAITKRPILSFNSKTFDENIFNKFLERDYTDSLKINLSQYDIENVANQFVSLKKQN